MNKTTTKNEIISTAKKLFLEKAFDNVSMRDIAGDLGISVGNLTYYFKKKEELAEKVLSDLFEKYQVPVPCKNLEELNNWFIFYEKLSKENEFYFKNYNLFSKIGGRIKEIQKVVFENTMEFWEKTFSNLIADEVVQLESFVGQYSMIARNLHFMKIYWQERLETEKNIGIKSFSYLNSVWGLIFPILTEKGKNIYLRKIILIINNRH